MKVSTLFASFAILAVVVFASILIGSATQLVTSDVHSQSAVTFGTAEPMTIQQTSKYHRDNEGNDLGGVASVGTSTQIRWRSEHYQGTEGATVLDVLRLANDRLKHLQKTPQASDANAKAMWELQKAIDLLEGKAPFPVPDLGVTQ